MNSHPSDIYFEHPQVNLTISNTEPYTHVFKGKNMSSKMIKRTSVDKGCSCTSYIVPEQIQPKEEFEVIITVDKTGQTGLFSTYVDVTFDTGQKVKLKVSGKLN